MSGHQFNLPWHFDGRTIYDCNGVPVAVALSYTSFLRQDTDGNVFNTSDYAGEIRAEAICSAVNASQGDIPC